MSLSPYLQMVAVNEAQSQKYLTINQQRDELEKIRAKVSVAAPSSGTLTLTSSQARFGVVEFTGTITGNVIVEMPTAMDCSVVLINSTTGAFTVKARWQGGSTQIPLPRGSFVPLRKIGSDVAFDSRGNVNGPYVSLARITTDQAVTGATDTKVALNSAVVDAASLFDSANNRWTAPVAGLYQIDAMVEYEILAGVIVGASAAECYLRKNGSVFKRGNMNPTGIGNVASVGRLSVGCVVPLAEGDYIELYVYVVATSTGGINVKKDADRTWMTAKLLSFG